MGARYDLRGKVAPITDGSRGLDLIMARQLLHQGARVAICARDEPELERARSHGHQEHEWVLTVPCDITDQEQVDTMVNAVRRHLGQISVQSTGHRGSHWVPRAALGLDGGTGTTKRSRKNVTTSASPGVRWKGLASLIKAWKKNLWPCRGWDYGAIRT